MTLSECGGVWTSIVIIVLCVEVWIGQSGSHCKYMLDYGAVYHKLS